MLPHPQSLQAGLDYLSLTFVEGEGPRSLYTHASSLLLQATDAGHTPRPFYAHGFVGIRAGDVMAARNGPSTWLSLSGQAAESHWLDLRRFGAKCTRVDLHLTGNFRPAYPSLASHEYGWQLALADRQTARKYSLISSSDGGETLYVGSRKSPQFGRLYDYGIRHELGVSGEMWRWEVELKAARAIQTWAMLTDLTTSCTLSAGLVSQWFAQRGVRCPKTTSATMFSPLPPRREPSLDDKLAWFRMQVKPSVDKLLSRGHRASVLASLGLDKE